jgi:hypothetical protein
MQHRRLSERRTYNIASDFYLSLDMNAFNMFVQNRFPTKSTFDHKYYQILVAKE